MSTAGIVYFLLQETTSLVKIGYTSNLKRRLRNLQCASGTELQVLFVFDSPDAFKTEQLIHKALATQRIPKSEWFSLLPEEIYALKFLQKALGGIEVGARTILQRKRMVYFERKAFIEHILRIYDAEVETQETTSETPTIQIPSFCDNCTHARSWNIHNILSWIRDKIARRHHQSVGVGVDNSHKEINKLRRYLLE